MADIIWGNGVKILSYKSFTINVTHQKDGNKEHYSEYENVQITIADVPGLPNSQADWNVEIMARCIMDAFLKCEVEKRDENGALFAKVSHSGVGGY